MGLLMVFFLLPTASPGVDTAKEFEAYYNPDGDYSRFWGRITDSDDAHRTLKIRPETNNARFLKIGDLVTFKIGSRRQRREYCRGYVKSQEEGYFLLHVEEVSLCWDEHYFRRGYILQFTSDVMTSRVRDASLFRTKLLQKREDFYRQLNDINHFIWSYDQQRILAVSSYDQKIMELQRQKRRALNSLVSKKDDYLKLQKKMSRELALIDQDLEFYKPEAPGEFSDSYNNDLTVPLIRKPTPPGTPPKERKDEGLHTIDVRVIDHEVQSLL